MRHKDTHVAMIEIDALRPAATGPAATEPVIIDERVGELMLADDLAS